MSYFSARVEHDRAPVVDGLKGFPEAINAVFPDTVVQTCIVHLIRHSIEFASWKDCKAIAGELRTILPGILHTAWTADLPT